MCADRENLQRERERKMERKSSENKVVYDIWRRSAVGNVMCENCMLVTVGGGGGGWVWWFWMGRGERCNSQTNLSINSD